MSMDYLIKVSKLFIGAWLIMIVSACTQSASPSNSADDAIPDVALVENSEAVDGLIEEYCTGCHNFEEFRRYRSGRPRSGKYPYRAGSG